MTKEERKKAIEVLDDMKVKIDIPKAAKTQNDRNWALDVAIQVLSQEPCNECKYKTFTELYFHTDPEMVEQEPCKTCGYAEGSPFCLQYCPYDADRKKEQESCDDAISRDAVLKEFEKGTENLYGRIDKLPSVTQKSGEWISVSERLPEGLLVKVLVSCEDSLGLPIVPKVVIYDGYEHLWECDEKVIAWMPLPEPYKAESEE